MAAGDLEPHLLDGALAHTLLVLAAALFWLPMIALPQSLFINRMCCQISWLATPVGLVASAMNWQILSISLLDTKLRSPSVWLAEGLAWQAPVWLRLLSTHSGQWGFLLAILAVLFGLSQWREARPPVKFCLLAIWLWSLAELGHASSEGELSLRFLSHYLHLWGVSFWFASLGALALSASGSAKPITGGRRFSTTMLLAMGLIWLTGLVRAAVVLSAAPTPALLRSSYFWCLGFKLLLVLAVLLLARQLRERLSFHSANFTEFAPQLWLEVFFAFTIALVSGLLSQLPEFLTDFSLAPAY